MKKALIVGIDDYPFAKLSGCVNDAKAINRILQHNADEERTRNFHTQLLTSDNYKVDRELLLHGLRELLLDKNSSVDVALLYFSGHGAEDDLGGYLITQDSKTYNDGIAISDVLQMANQSTAKEVVIILDCCHSGHLGTLPQLSGQKHSLLRKGISILTASQEHQLAVENNGKGIFTSIVVDALNGSAADILGNVTVASVYSHADQLLTPWEQRPSFKTNISQTIALRKCKPKVKLSILRNINTYFTNTTTQYNLNPSYEPTAKPVNRLNEQIFGELQQLRDAGLVKPVNCANLYDAAMQSLSCCLTPLGQFYWQMNNKRLI